MLHTWKHTRLGEVCNFQNGFAFKNSDYIEDADGACEIFRMGHILRGGGFNPNGKKALVPYAQAKKLGRFLLNKGDILMCMTDMKSSMALLGHTALMPVSGQYLLNQRVGRITIKNPEVLDLGFLYYYSNSPNYIDWLRSHANSGVQVNLSTEAILDSPIPLPPVAVQRRIAGILLAYDDLMRNNARRIQLVEKMAQRFYGEWFVQFRFPGHENVKIVENSKGVIPEGWSVKSVSDFGEVKTGKTPSKTDQANFGFDVPFLKLPDMHGRLFCIDTSEKLSNKGAGSQASKFIPANSLCVSCIGTAGIVNINAMECHTNQQINSLIPDKSHNREFLYFELTGLKELINKYGANGATMVNLNKTKFEALPVLFPDEKVVKRFHQITHPLFEQILSLQKKNEVLRSTRDLLLPKLIAGEIDVSNFPDPVSD